MFLALTLGAPSALAGDGPESRTGILRIEVADDLEMRRSELRYLLEEPHGGKPARLRFARTPPGQLRSGATVKVHGHSRGGEFWLAADGSGGSAIETLVAASGVFGGEQRTLVVVTDFRDAQVTCTPQEIEEFMFTSGDGYSVDDLLREMSFDRLHLSGKVSGPVTIDYLSSDSCATSAWASAANTELRARGEDPGQYDRLIYVLPTQNTCGWAGLGELGGATTRAWVFRCGREDVYAHELGHGFGMHHAATDALEYGDSSDFMGATGRLLRQVNAPHHHQMGWRGSDVTVDARDSGVYELAPLELPPGMALAPQILRVAKPDTNEFYYLSYREALGFDANLAAGQRDRLVVHRYAGDGSSRRTYLIGHFLEGESFEDPANGVRVTSVSREPRLLRLRLDLQHVEPPADDTPPEMPRWLSARAHGKHVTLSWDPSQDDVGVVAYTISRDGAWLAESAEPSWKDHGALPGIVHEYRVSARDAAGNESPPSAAAVATVRSAGGKRKN